MHMVFYEFTLYIIACDGFETVTQCNIVLNTENSYSNVLEELWSEGRILAIIHKTTCCVDDYVGYGSINVHI